MSLPDKLIKMPAAAGTALRAPNRSQAPVRLSLNLPWSEFDVPTSHGRIAVRMGRGQGVPLLFLHGNSSDKDAFSAQMSGSLWESCRMMALDLPGHGASPDAADPARTYSISAYADAVIEVLEHLDIARVALVGWSLGGHVALEIAARYPGVLGVMLCGTPPVGNSMEAIAAGFTQNPDLALVGQENMTSSEIERFARLTVGQARHSGVNASIARTDGRARAYMFNNLIAGGVSDQRAFVENTTIPIAIVNGDDDPIVNVPYLKGLQPSSLWYRRVHLIRHGGHAPFATQPKRFEKVLARFIRTVRHRHRFSTMNPDLCLSG